MLDGMLSGWGGLVGICEHIKIFIYSKRANKMQETCIKRLMRKNKTTEYGKLHNFDKVKSIEDYQKIVPLSVYADYDDYVWRMANGEKGLITNMYVRRFTESSGSTGKQKLVPLSYWAEWVCQCFSFSAPVGCAVKWFAKKGRPLPPQKGLLTAETSCRRVKGGTISCLSSIPLLNVKPIVQFFTTSPKEVLFPEPDVDMDMHYMKLRFALANRNISYLGTIFITTLESMFFYMEENWEMLCDDIEKGIINDSVNVPEEIRAKYNKKLKPNPKRADELRKEFKKGFDESPIIPRIWPNVGWMYGMGTGSLSFYAKKLRRYIGDDIPMHYLGYTATEAFMAVPLEFNSYDYVILPQNGFYEFRPIDQEGYDNLLTIKDLEVGKEYEIILTNMSGFYRYRIEDVIKVTGYYNQSPKITFCYRLNQIANISGEKVSSLAFDEMVANLSETTGDLYIGYSIYADRSTSPGHYKLFLELAEDISDEKKATYNALFEEMLCKGNVSVEPLIKSGALGHPEVLFLKKGTYDDYREVLRSRGANLNQVKPIKVIDNDEKRDFFFSHVVKD
ncbi:MAG: GH3 auxin-responsive promoter family protein [Clostridia bacterium]|nr:GH3 auxin-responsive promoter family protein [Clostridia bacterium]MBP3559641.1 GH3 auxin-responsive promoter family protein [Clostridia bacterium]